MKNNSTYTQMLLIGTGAALSVALGSIPDFCRVTNLTDGDSIEEWLRIRFAAFTSGGTTEIKKNQRIKGATSGATARVKDVLLASGSWAAGTAAGFILIDAGDVETVGTLTGENVYIDDDATSGTDDATLSAAFSDRSINIAAAVATNAADGITHYAGDVYNSPGVTLGTDVSESGKLLLLQAWWGETQNYAAIATS